MPWIVLLMVLIAFKADAMPFSDQEMEEIAQKIWENECRRSIDGLTAWNSGENFGSFGIGHFIWYPAGKTERFKETFPDLLKFLEQKRVALPSWLKKAQGCPWNSREEFYQQFSSPEMQALRRILQETVHLQASFLLMRLENALPEMTKSLPQVDRAKISRLFSRMEASAAGRFALIDYLNFKGKGTDPKETYQGKGWGLLQVLQRMPGDSANPLQDFIQAASDVLRERVKNSAPERGEERWLQGWINRLNGYR